MPQHLTLLLNSPFVIAVIFISGIGGTFQYGFCISVMTSPSNYIKGLVNLTCQQRYDISLEPWQLSLIWSFMVSLLPIGGLVGSLLSRTLNSKFSRKQCLFMSNLVAVSGAIMMITSKIAMSFEMIMVARFVYGINAGINLSVHPMYLMECTPKKLCGTTGVTVCTFIALGKLVGQVLGISELLGTEERWPWLLGFNGFIALAQLCTLPLLPESPVFLLLNRGDQEACVKAMKKLWGDRDYSRDVEEMLKQREGSQNTKSYSLLEVFQNRSVRWPLITVVVSFAGIQLCGINAIYFYSFDIFRQTGIQEEQLPYITIGLGCCEVFTSIICFLIIENLKKIWLLSTGLLTMSIMMGLLTISSSLQALVSWMVYFSIPFLFLFIIAFISGSGSVIPTLPVALFTQPFLPAIFALACMLNWTGFFILGMLFPIIVEHMGHYCFLLFLVVSLGCFLHLRFQVPEISQKTVQEISAEFKKMHSKKPTTQTPAAGGSQIISTIF